MKTKECSCGHKESAIKAEAAMTINVLIELLTDDVARLYDGWPHGGYEKVKEVIKDRLEEPVAPFEKALIKIVQEFDSLNGRECTRGCGECIRCIASRALGVRWGTDHEDPGVGVFAVNPKLLPKDARAEMTNKM